MSFCHFELKVLVLLTKVVTKTVTEIGLVTEILCQVT